MQWHFALILIVIGGCKILLVPCCKLILQIVERLQAKQYALSGLLIAAGTITVKDFESQLHVSNLGSRHCIVTSQCT
jgi:hypothetical protein